MTVTKWSNALVIDAQWYFTNLVYTNKVPSMSVFSCNINKCCVTSFVSYSELANHIIIIIIMKSYTKYKKQTSNNQHTEMGLSS